MIELNSYNFHMIKIEALFKKRTITPPVTVVPGNLDILKGPQDRHLPLGPIVRHGLAHIPISKEDLVAGDPASSLVKEWEIWKGLKGEKNALTSFFISEIWEQTCRLQEEMRDMGSDIGLGEVIADLHNKGYAIQPISANDILEPIRELKTITRDMFNLAVSRWDAEQLRRQGTIDLSEQTDMDRAYARLTSIIDFGRLTRLTRNEGVGEFIERGVITATETIWDILEVIPKVFEIEKKRPINRSEIEEIAKNSLPLVMQLAAGNSNRTVPLLHALNHENQLSPFDPHYFTIAKRGGKLGLHITEHALQTIKLKSDKGPSFREVFRPIPPAVPPLLQKVSRRMFLLKCTIGHWIWPG